MAETKRSRVFFDINIGKSSAGRVTFELVGPSPLLLILTTSDLLEF
jgi:hypothetical protein